MEARINQTRGNTNMTLEEIKNSKVETTVSIYANSDYIVGWIEPTIEISVLNYAERNCFDLQDKFGTDDLTEEIYQYVYDNLEDLISNLTDEEKLATIGKTEDDVLDDYEEQLARESHQSWLENCYYKK